MCLTLGFWLVCVLRAGGPGPYSWRTHSPGETQPARYPRACIQNNSVKNPRSNYRVDLFASRLKVPQIQCGIHEKETGFHGFFKKSRHFIELITTKKRRVTVNPTLLYKWMYKKQSTHKMAVYLALNPPQLCVRIESTRSRISLFCERKLRRGLLWTSHFSNPVIPLNPPDTISWLRQWLRCHEMQCRVPVFFWTL